MKIKITTNFGDIILSLDEEKAPITSANFADYVKDNFFNGTIFHRVIDGFMIQGGGFEPGMKEKATKDNIQNEASNGLPNKRGSIAMARTPDPHSASSQFFINLVDNTFLNFQSETPQGWGYCVFGEVEEGMDVVDKIAKVATTSKAGHQDVPAEEVVMTSVVML